MNMAISVFEYKREGKCVYMFRYRYAAIIERNLQMGKDSRHMSRVMRSSIGTVLLCFIDPRVRKIRNVT